MEQLVIGVDVAKTTLDICFKPLCSTIQVANNHKGFQQWYGQLKRLSRFKSVMVVMEHTGGYSCRFESFLRSKSIDYCKVPALQIKRSLGMIRGKDDKVDAQRIAEYGWLRREQLEADKPIEQEIQRLRMLLSLRSKMVRDRSGYICRLKELRNAYDWSKSDPIMKTHQKCIAILTQEIAQTEKQIQQLINSNPTLKKNYDLIRTIKGVGHIIAAFMISCTNNFKNFSEARKFNCYAGLAPFKQESGISIRGRSRVSHLANKEAKTLLNLAASCAIRCDIELKRYYQRRVLAGMRKMSCLNIIRTKIVARIFAVAKRQTPFVTLPMAA